MKLVNLTQHTINEVVTGQAFEPSGQIARVTVEYTVASSIGDIPLYTATYGDIEGLPDPVDGVTYIVSGMVKAAVPERGDVVSPGNLVRDENGKPIGCDGFKI
jgi:hypothetical protein